MYVAERDDRIAGFAQLNVERGEVEAVYVSPEDVRTKVGSALLDQLETVAMHRGVRTLTLKSTLNAERFYLRQGYERLGPGDHFGLACIRMRKHLSR
jgi:putative acetyltransferase